jgi:Abnormal spindle-like microcephaly-assoc'd, ASPM-SPD-2-Hydin
VTGSGFFRVWAISILFLFAILLSPTLANAQQLSASPSSLGFENVLVGSSKTQTVSVHNIGTRRVTLSGAAVSGAGFSVHGPTFPMTLAAGSSVALSLTFAPLSVGNDTGSVSVNATAGRRHIHRSTITVSLTGAGTTGPGQLAASPASLSFGSSLTGQSHSLSTTLTNMGRSSVTISQANTSNAAFALTGLTLPATLAAGHSLTFSIFFTATSTGAASGQVAIFSDASNSQLNIALTGNGTAAGQLTLAPGTLNFGSVATGSSESLSGTLTAIGSSVTVSTASSSSAEFGVSGISLPATLAAGKSVPFTVTFHPQASGNATASLSFLSNATTSSITEVLTGSGAGALQHMVSLSWTPSTSAGVVGYNLYRSTVSGGPYTEIVSRNSNFTFSDTTVVAGQTYYYVVTSVDGNGAESVHSNQAQAAVPAP